MTPNLVVNILILLVLLCLLYWAGNAIMAASGVGEPIPTYFRVFLVVLVVLYLVGMLTGNAPAIYHYTR